MVDMRERDRRTRAHPVIGTDTDVSHATVHQNVEAGSELHSYEHSGYNGLGGIFYKHETIIYGAGEYANAGVSTNGIESVWEVMKRRLHGSYHHASKKHVSRYVNEFTFRLNDGNVVGHYTLQRLDSLVDAAAGRRITYKELTA